MFKGAKFHTCGFPFPPIFFLFDSTPSLFWYLGGLSASQILLLMSCVKVLNSSSLLTAPSRSISQCANILWIQIKTSDVTDESGTMNALGSGRQYCLFLFVSLYFRMKWNEVLCILHYPGSQREKGRWNLFVNPSGLCIKVIHEWTKSLIKPDMQWKLLARILRIRAILLKASRDENIT